MPGYEYLSPAELAQIRGDQDKLRDEIGGTGNIVRPTYTPNGRGGTTRALTTVYSNIPMRIWISSGPNGTTEESKFWGEQEISVTDAFLQVRWDIALELKDIVQWGGREWQIVGIQATDTHNTAIRARLESLRR